MYFDESLSFAPVAEKNTDPILPEERFQFELVGLERSEPDQYRKNGGIKWSFRVLNMDGSPFLFQDDEYILWRTTGVNANGTPLMNIGTQANDWASALLGRQLGVDDTLKVSELRGKRMSAMVVWRPKRTDPKSKTIDLASLRHVGTAVSSARPADPTTVSEDPTPEDVDRALAITSLQKAIKRLLKVDRSAGERAQAAYEDSDFDTAPMSEIQNLAAQVKAAYDKAMEDDD